MYIPIGVILIILLFISPDFVILGLLLVALFWLIKWVLIILFMGGFLLFDYVCKISASTENLQIIGFIIFSVIISRYIAKCFNNRTINIIDKDNQELSPEIKNDERDVQNSFLNKSIYRR